jgi:Flp pilus assembly pilin Flp
VITRPEAADVGAPGALVLDGHAPQQTASSTMNRFLPAVIAVLGEQDGQDLLEYAMLCALIAIVAIGAIQNVGNTINTVLWQVIAAASF